MWAVGDERLSDAARAAIEEDQSVAYVSVATVYEVEFKHELGKLEDVVAKEFALAVERGAFAWLPIEPEDARVAARLPLVHRDPWDRIIAAQAKRRALIVISSDPAFDALGAPRLW